MGDSLFETTTEEPTAAEPQAPQATETDEEKLKRLTRSLQDAWKPMEDSNVALAQSNRELSNRLEQVLSQRHTQEPASSMEDEQVRLLTDPSSYIDEKFQKQIEKWQKEHPQGDGLEQVHGAAIDVTPMRES